jgi:hypothetical protein
MKADTLDLAAIFGKAIHYCYAEGEAGVLDLLRCLWPQVS